MDSLDLSVQNHSEFNQICQKLKLMLKEQRNKIRENNNISAEKDVIIKRITILKVSMNSNVPINSLLTNNCISIYNLRK
jgi:hypothetical protein